jgi:hypothetical protein
MSHRKDIESFQIGIRKFDLRYLRMIADLPGISIAPDVLFDNDAMGFMFRNGAGFVMPLSPG